MAYKSFILLIVAISLNCNPPTPVAPIPTPIVTDSEFCLVAEQHLESMQCVKHSFTPDGKSFAPFCKETQASGIFINPKCLSEVKTCDQVLDCTHSR